MNRKEIIIDDVKFTLTELSSYGFGIGVRKWSKKIDTNHFIIKTVHRAFDKNLYYFPHTPIVVDDVYNVAKFSRRSNLRVLDMPIKFPRSEYKIPKELNQFDEIISKIISFEHTINPFIDQYYAYLTIDQGEVEKNTFQRNPGCHVDGFQGNRVKEKRPINRSYIVYDDVSPIFYAQNFKTSHLNEKTDDFFLSFDEQADETNAITFDPYQIILMNAFTVHKSAKSERFVYRTFIRLSYDTMIFDRFGNTHNPMFQYNWNMVSRDTKKHLKHNSLLSYNQNAF